MNVSSAAGLLADGGAHMGIDLTTPSAPMAVALFVIALALLLASAGGIGGGGILVPLFIMAFGWTPRYAIPLSNITIFAGGLMNTLVNFQKRHPNVDRPLIDWDMVLMMEPLTILGALIGSFLNRILPEFILILLLAIVLAATASRTVKKGVKLWAKETQENKAKKKKHLPLSSPSSRQHDVEGKKVGRRRGTKGSQSNGLGTIEEGNAEEDEGREEKEGLLRSCSVGDRVRVRDTDREKWGRGVIASKDRSGRFRVRKDGHDKAFLYAEIEREDLSEVPEPRFTRSPTSPAASPTSGGGSSAENQKAEEELTDAKSSHGEAVAPREAVEDIIERHQPVGTTAAAAALSVFVPMPHPMRFEKSDKVLCQRSNGEWTHAKVHSFEPWPPEGGTLTLQVDKYRRKVLDLSKRRHLERVRVPKDMLTTSGASDTILSSKTDDDDDDDDDGSNRWDLLGAESPSERLKEIEDDERRHSSWKISLLFVSWVGVVALDLTKELTECGSPAYFMTAALTLPWVLMFFFGYRSYLLRRQDEKTAVGFPFAEGDVEWNTRSTVIYPVLCILAGFFAGLFGVGGGIIKGPLMLEMGVLPPVAAANAATMILFTTGIAALTFLLFGAIDPPVGVLLFAMGIVCTGVGQFFLGIALKKANRQSLIVLSMGSTIVLSAILLTLRSFVDAFSRDGGLPALMALGQLCGSESSEDTGGGYMEGHASEYADVVSISPAAPRNSLPSSPDMAYAEAPCLPGYEPPCYTRVRAGAGDGF